MTFTAIGPTPASSWRPMAPYLTARALLRQAKVAKTPRPTPPPAARSMRWPPRRRGLRPGRRAGMQRISCSSGRTRRRRWRCSRRELMAPTLDAGRGVRLPGLRRPERQDDADAGDPRLDRDDQGERRGRAGRRTRRPIGDTGRGAEARPGASRSPTPSALAGDQGPGLADRRARPRRSFRPGRRRRSRPTRPRSRRHRRPYITAAYQRVRLTINTAPQAETRAFLDADAGAHRPFDQRPQPLHRRTHAARRGRGRLRPAGAPHARSAPTTPATTAACAASSTRKRNTPPSTTAGKVGIGPDAMALIDRMPLAERAALATDANLPATLRLDIGLTTWTRAVLEQDDGQINALSVALETLLPAEKANLATVVKTPSGPAKRFAEFFIMAQMPGLATDLMSYTRPSGARLVAGQLAGLDDPAQGGRRTVTSRPPCLLDLPARTAIATRRRPRATRRSGRPADVVCLDLLRRRRRADAAARTSWPRRAPNGRGVEEARARPITTTTPSGRRSGRRSSPTPRASQRPSLAGGALLAGAT